MQTSPNLSACRFYHLYPDGGFHYHIPPQAGYSLTRCMVCCGKGKLMPRWLKVS